MADIEFSRLSSEDTVLRELIGFHYRVIQTQPIQDSLCTHTDDQVVEVLRSRYGSVPLLDVATKTFRQCAEHGGVFVARLENSLLGYIAYSPSTGKELALTHRPSEPVAIINFFRVPNINDTDTAKELIDMALSHAREQGHFRIAYSRVDKDLGELYLEKMLPRTALGTDDIGRRLRVMGLNAADIALGVYRRPDYLKGPSTFILKP